MSSYGERLKMYRKHAGLTQKELAAKLGIDHSAVSNWERDVYKFDIEMLIPISEALGVSVNDLLGFYTDFSLDEQEEELIKIFRELDDDDKATIVKMSKAFEALKNSAIKVTDTIKVFVSQPVFLLAASAGTGQFLDSDEYELMDFPEDAVPRESTFGVRVSGDSMEPDYKNGSIVFVKRTKHLNPGDVGIFVLNGEGYLKILGKNGTLQSINPDYDDIQIHEWDDCRIVGKVIGSYKNDNKRI